jgi:hypothetical protein
MMITALDAYVVETVGNIHLFLYIKKISYEIILSKPFFSF